MQLSILIIKEVINDSWNIRRVEISSMYSILRNFKINIKVMTDLQYIQKLMRNQYRATTGRVF